MGVHRGAMALTALLSTLAAADDATHGSHWLHTTKSDAYHDNAHRQLDAAQYGVHPVDAEQAVQALYAA